MGKRELEGDALLQVRLRGVGERSRLVCKNECEGDALLEVRLRGAVSGLGRLEKRV